MKRIWMAALAALLLLAAAPMVLASGSEEFKVGVTVIVSHPALEADQKGFEQALTDAGLTVKYDIQNAQGEMSNAQTIAQKFVHEKIDLVHAIATPTAQAAVKAIKNIPVVYSSVTDPVTAGLVKSMGPSGTNVTGVSDMTPVFRQIELYKEMMPNAKKWGTIYNAGEANAVVLNNLAKTAAQKLGLEWVEVTIANSSEIYTAAQSLAGRVDAIYISTDNTVVSGLAALVKVANQKKIPVFAADTSSVKGGACAALGFNYFQVGYSAGKKAAMILKGEKKAGQIPSGYAEKLSLWVSPHNAKAQGLEIPAKYIKMAEKIVE